MKLAAAQLVLAALMVAGISWALMTVALAAANVLDLIALTVEA